MSIRPPVYLAGPYASGSRQGEADNTALMLVIARFAVSEGYAPILAHPTVLLGGFGDDGDPTDREAGLDACCRLVEMVAQDVGGSLWVLSRDDGSLSLGTAREIDAFLGYRCMLTTLGHPAREDVIVKTRQEWVETMANVSFDHAGARAHVEARWGVLCALDLGLPTPSDDDRAFAQEHARHESASRAIVRSFLLPSANDRPPE